MAKKRFGNPDKIPDPLLIALISQFLSNHGFNSSLRIFNTERRKRPKKHQIITDTYGEKYTQGIPQLDEIFRSFIKQHKVKIQDKPVTAAKDASEEGSDSDSDGSDGSVSSQEEKEEVSGTKITANVDKKTKTAKLSASISSSSSSSSDSDSSSESSAEEDVPSQEPVAIKKSLKRKARSSSSESSSSSSSSGSSGSSSGSSHSSNDSESSEEHAPPSKRQKTEPSQRNKSESSSSSPSSSSGSDSEQPDASTKAKGNAVKASHSDDNESSSSSGSDGSSGDSSSDEEDSEALGDTTNVDTAATTLVEASSDGSVTITGDVDPPQPLASTEKKHKGARPTKLAELSAQAQDGEYISNSYVSYNYADRAYNDLSVTRGKGFTKEKNKKKRGSYRGGAIDTSGGKGFKFDD